MALFLLQTVHSAIFLVSIAATIWIWVCLLTNRSDRWMWWGAIWLGGIGVSLVLNGGVCPLQDLAQWIDGTDAYVQDMLTPEWFNDLAVPVVAPPAVLGIAGLLIRLVMRRRKA